VAYGLNRIKARLQQTRESLIASIVLVLNLIKKIALGAYFHILSMRTYPAKSFMKILQENITYLFSFGIFEPDTS